VGLSLAYRDVLQNLEKIERGVHEYLRHYQSMSKENNIDSSASIPSPTLRQLLQFELGTKLHKNLPRLKDQSAASGILWTKRQVHYQTALFRNFLEVPECYPSPKDAAIAAYQIVYNDYHGWAVKRIFTHSYGGSPPLDKIWLSICPPTDLPKNHVGSKHEYKTRSKVFESSKHPKNYPSSAPQRLDPNSASISHISSSASSGTQEDDDEVLAALDNFRHEIVEKWEDLLRMFNCGKEEKKKWKRSLILSSESHFDLNQLNTEMIESSLRESSSICSSDINSIVTSSTVASCSSSFTVETAISRQQVNDNLIERSKRGVQDFVRNVSPMIADVGKLMDELNMNDPSKA